MTSFKNGICERCCKHVDGHSAHTCTPTKGWREMEEKLRIAEEALCEYESREIDSGNLRGGLAAVTLTKLNGG